MVRRAILALACVWALAAQADPAADLKATQAQIEASRQAQARSAERARQAEQEQQRLRGEQAKQAARLREAEQRTAELAQRMDELASAKVVAQRALDARATNLAPLLPVIERLSLYPAETMLAVPATPEDALRGVLVLRGIGRELERQAEAIAREQKELDRLGGEIARAAPALEAAQATQAARATELDRALARTEDEREAAVDEAAQRAREAADAAARAKTLQGVIADVERARAAEEARAHRDAARADRRRQAPEAAEARRREARVSRPSGPDSLVGDAAPRGQLVAPVAGRIGRAWGEPTEAGPANGISYLPPPEARVVSPCAGRVVFSAPFRGYGPMVIVDCGGGYHAVMAGLARLDAGTGRTVAAGEPVGLMAGWDPKAGGARPSLYVELRRGGAAINPAPWLRTAG